MQWPPPIPTPFPVPTPGGETPLDVSTFWQIESIETIISMARSVLVFADQYKFFTVALMIGLVLAVVWLISRIVGQRESTV